MGAEFLKLTDFRTKEKYRVRISEIVGYSKLTIPEAYGESSTIVDVKALLTADQISQLEVTETPEEIDEMLFRAKHSTAAVVGRAEPAGDPSGHHHGGRKEMRWAIDYAVKDGRYWKRKIVEAEDIESALQKAKEELLAERVDAFIFTIDSMVDPDDLITEEEVEDEQ